MGRPLRSGHTEYRGSGGAVSDTHEIEFIPSGRGKAQCDPDPNYPDGIALDCSSHGDRTCTVELPYPAPECGIWIIHCKKCGMSVAATAAGRLDDPISIRMRCMEIVN